MRKTMDLKSFDDPWRWNVVARLAKESRLT
jgi:hypothetical protein